MNYHTPKILYVDDDRMSYQIIREQLPSSVIIEHVESGKECIEAVKKSPPDLIILNIDLPDASGPKLAKKLKTNQNSKAIELLLITDTDYVSIDENIQPLERETLKLGKLEHVVYPKCNSGELIDEIHEVLDIPVELKKMNVLIADDSKTVVEMLSHYIEQMGHKTVIAHDGVEAVEAIKDSEAGFDLILMDGEMPNLNGLEATRQIRAYSKQNWIPVIFISSHHDGEYIEQAIQYGADDYLVKPVSYIILRSKVQSMARLSQMRIELKIANQALAKLSHYDPLTNLFNRRAYEEFFDREWKRMTRDETELSLIMIDIDHFKLYNDHYGHHAGDKLLKQVSELMLQQLKRPSDFLARLGGEEFAILLPGIPVKKAVIIAKRIEKALAAIKIEHAASTTDKYLTVSMGICSSTYAKSPEGLFTKADKALYHAKETGRNQIAVYDPDIMDAD